MIAEPPSRSGPPEPPEPSRRRATGWIMLILFAPPAAWLLWEIGRVEGFDSGRLWQLLREDRTFAFAMLDFFLTAGFAAIVLIERADRRDPKTWIFLAIFCVIPTLGIILFLIFAPRAGRSYRSGREAPTPRGDSGPGGDPAC